MTAQQISNNISITADCCVVSDAPLLLPTPTTIVQLSVSWRVRLIVVFVFDCCHDNCPRWMNLLCNNWSIKARHLKTGTDQHTARFYPHQRLIVALFVIWMEASIYGLTNNKRRGGRRHIRWDVCFVTWNAIITYLSAESHSINIDNQWAVEPYQSQIGVSGSDPDFTTH